MSVTVSSNGELRSLNRVQPIDPAYVQSWAVDLTGDASGGVADITFAIPADHAFIPLWFKAIDSAGSLVAELQVNPGIDVQGVSLRDDLVEEQVTVISSTSRFHFTPERILFVPDPGAAGSFRVRVVNPTATDTLTGAGQAYLWPVNEVRALSPRQLWYFLQ